MQPHKLEPERQQRAEFLAEGVGNKKTKTRETTEPESAHVQSAIPSHFHVRIALNPCNQHSPSNGHECTTSEEWKTVLNDDDDAASHKASRTSVSFSHIADQ